MNFFSDERANELRDLFFESAQELMQALNEEGLELEKRPTDTEIIRTIRRTVHTLKGDSAACGFKELSELAHELEDVLTPELAMRPDGATAQLVLSAADMFDAMLSAYRNNLQPPSGEPLRRLVASLRQAPAAPAARFAPAFAWTEYDRLVIAQGAPAGVPLFNIAVQVDPATPMRFAAMQLIRNVLHESGTPLVVRPEDVNAEADSVEAVIASERDADWITRKCRIPSVSSEVVVAQFADQVPVTPMASVEAQPPVIAVVDDVLGLAATLPEVPEPSPIEFNIGAASAREPLPVAKEASREFETERSTPSPAPSTAIENILRVEAERIDTVLNLVGELIIGKSMLHQTVSEFSKRFPKDPLRGKFADMMAYQAQVLNELQRSVMKIRMVPVEQLFRRFPRVVRDVAKRENKEVQIVLSGQDTDLDKSILDALAEPMTHLVRNAVDHGIEMPADRVAAGKAAQGAVKLDAYHQGNHVVIEVSDDGRGIDPGKVIAKAIERGVVTAEQASRMSDSEILDLVFEPGFSTAAQVTEISGRGVGLDVVKTVLDRMKGTVTIKSEPGYGTTFLLKVPLTLAIIRALLFRVSGKMYAVPLSSVLEIARAGEGEIHKVDGAEVMQLRDQVLTLVRLSRISKKPDQPGKKPFVIVIALGDRKFGLIVDKLVGEEELVIKALDDHLVATELVSGASILGDGTVVLILNLTAVVERFGKTRIAVGSSVAGSTDSPVVQSVGAQA